MFLLQRKLYFSKDPVASNFFVGEGVQMLISIETHITCDFPGGPGIQTPYHPLWIGTWSHCRITLPHYMCKLPGIHFTSWICHNGILCSIILLLSGIMHI